MADGEQTGADLLGDVGEWLASWVGELKDMRRVLGLRTAEELATVPGIDKQLDRIAQRRERAGETARAAGQPRQIMAQLRVAPFHGVGLAPLDVVDLAVLEFGRPIESAPPSAERIRLRPFPNRTTNYEFGLINRSGRARKVQVELFALPAPPPEQRESLESPLDALGNPKPGVKRLAGPS